MFNEPIKEKVNWMIEEKDDLWGKTVSYLAWKMGAYGVQSLGGIKVKQRVEKPSTVNFEAFILWIFYWSCSSASFIYCFFLGRGGPREVVGKLQTAGSSALWGLMHDGLT